MREWTICKKISWSIIQLVTNVETMQAGVDVLEGHLSKLPEYMTGKLHPLYCLVPEGTEWF